MSAPVYIAQNGSDAAELLDMIAKEKGRPVRVYVLGYKERPRDEMERLIRSADICVTLEGWQAIDDHSRHEWVNR